VIFDIDGTLAESGQLGFDATNVVLRNNNASEITFQQYLEGCRYTTPVRLAWHLGLSEVENSDEFRSVGQRLGEEFDKYYINLVSYETAPFYPGILSLIENLPTHVKLGALTNAAGLYAHAVLKANSVQAASLSGSKFYELEDEGSLYKRFGCIFGADEVPKPKPFGDGLLKVCGKLDVNPSECVYIGDASSDGMAAQAAGMPAVGVTWGANKEEALVASNVFTSICRTVDDLANILPQIK
jgi:phosphoglycolate phosphatase-like HAD superfamily hydrolase